MEVEAATLSGFEPTLDGSALVRAVVIQNQMNIEFRRYLLFQLIEELYEFLAAMAREATADDLAVENVASILRSKRLTCPRAPCEVTDRRGLAFAQPALYVAEHGRAQIMIRSFGPSAEEPVSTGDLDGLGVSKSLPGTPDIITAPSGVAAAEQMLFITDDRAGSASAQSSGALYVCSSTDCRPELVSDRLHHPSGVAAAAKDGPVYVADMNAHQIQWPIFRKTLDRGWIRSGALGSAAFTGPPPPP